MKVLFVYNFDRPDYQSDGIYHGLIDSGVEVYETHYPSYMLSDFQNSNQIYGKGFSIFGKLNHTPRLETSEVIKEKIKSNFYDFVIFGCIYTHFMFPDRSCLDYLDEVIQSYSKEKVHFIDGGDDPNNYGYGLSLYKYGTVWKTNLYDARGNSISFAIPESQLIDYIPNKEKIFSYIVPGKPETYIYDNEKDYYNDYASSYYGTTWKKGQWNCLRHLEILANRCIPYFPGLEDCPKTILTNFPKNIILESNKYAERGVIHPQYNELNEILFNHTKDNLTTKKLAEKLLNPIQERNYYFTSKLEEASPDLPYIKFFGNSEHPYAKIIEDAYKKASLDLGNLPEWVLKYDGASGKRYRYMINNIISNLENPTYLEIGMWTGSTLFAAMANNKVKVTGIDNWTQGFYGDVKNWFYKNLANCVTFDNQVSLYQTEFQKIDYAQIGKHNIFLYDGPHDEQEQYDGIRFPYNALDETFILIVDDWNWPGPRNGTFNALKDSGIDIIYSIEIRTTSNDYFPSEECLSQNHNWHDGYFIAVCKKTRGN